MQIYTNLDKFIAHKPVITMGTFDGVHLGHHQLLNKAKEIAQETNGESAVLTFWPHPRMVVNDNKKELFLLNTLDEKIELIAEAQIEHLIICHFTKAFSQTNSNNFIENILVKKLKAKQIIIGYDHHFGKDREGNFDNLKILASQYDFKVHNVNLYKNENLKISSSSIRAYIKSGDIKSAGKLLGYNYFITGTVTNGKKIGRTIGFPTANLVIEYYKILPATGVYAVFINIDGKQYKGMLNIGYKPTICSNQTKRSVEVNIFDFETNIYNKLIKVCFIQKMRDEQKFKDINDLKIRLNQDKHEAMKILNSL